MIALYHGELRTQFEILSKEARIVELLGGRVRVSVSARQPLPPAPDRASRRSSSKLGDSGISSPTFRNGTALPVLLRSSRASESWLWALLSLRERAMNHHHDFEFDRGDKLTAIAFLTSLVCRWQVDLDATLRCPFERPRWTLDSMSRLDRLRSVRCAWP